MGESRPRKTRVFEVVGMFLLQLPSKVSLHLGSKGGLILWLLVKFVVFSEFSYLVVLAGDKFSNSPNSPVHISSLVTSEKSSTNQGFTYVCNGFISELVRVGSRRSFTLRQNETLRIPGSAIEALGPNVLVKLELHGVIFQVLVAYQHHAVNMVAVLVVLRVNAE